jgi:hypothetical protein
VFGDAEMNAAGGMHEAGGDVERPVALYLPKIASVLVTACSGSSRRRCIVSWLIGVGDWATMPGHAGAVGVPGDHERVRGTALAPT